MSVEKVVVPDIGDFESVDVVEVLVSPGDRVAKEDPLITLESDKASMDVPSPLAGRVAEVEVEAGSKVSEGDVILTLETEESEAEAETDDEAEKEKENEKEEVEPSEKEPEEKPGERGREEETAETESDREKEEKKEREAEPDKEPEEAKQPEKEKSPSAREVLSKPPPVADHKSTDAEFSQAYASPAVRRFARELGVDLGRVDGSGRKGRILKEDVQAFVKKSLADREAPAAGLALPRLPEIDFSRFGEVEKQPLSRIQKISGPRLQAAWLTMPHVTQHDEADITELEDFRQEHKAEAKEQGFNLTPLAFVMKATVGALKKYPTLNASLDPDGETLILKRYYHLGFAVDTSGGLVVPVIREVDRKGVFDVARELGEISAEAREGKLKPDQIQGASFTISSLGGIGGTFFTPIVNPPEVAILGVSRAYQKPVWREGAFRPQLTLPLSLSYDHRVVDGATAVRFTTYLCELLADVRRLLL